MKNNSFIHKIHIVLILSLLTSSLLSAYFVKRFDKYEVTTDLREAHSMIKSDIQSYWVDAEIFKNDLNGVFNGVSPNPISNKDFIIRIAKFLNKPLIFPNLRKWMMCSILGEMHIIIFESQNVSCEKLNQTKFKFQFDYFDQAIEDLLK